MRSERVRINRLTQVLRFVRVSRLLLWTIWVIYRLIRGYLYFKDSQPIPA